MKTNFPLWAIKVFVWGLMFPGLSGFGSGSWAHGPMVLAQSSGVEEMKRLMDEQRRLSQELDNLEQRQKTGPAQRRRPKAHIFESGKPATPSPAQQSSTPAVVEEAPKEVPPPEPAPAQVEEAPKESPAPEPSPPVKEELAEPASVEEVPKEFPAPTPEPSPLTPSVESIFTPKPEVTDDMVEVAAGDFWAGEVNALSKKSVAKFFVDRYEVIQRDYERLMGTNPSVYIAGQNPVDNVSFNDAEAYCGRVGKRLPTEWEWEKAARGESPTMYFWGPEPDSDYAWFGEDVARGHHQVGLKKPNAYGLHDMTGNVWEWTSSEQEGRRVLRGGSWNDLAHSVRIAIRGFEVPTGKHDNVGFRCARD